MLGGDRVPFPAIVVRLARQRPRAPPPVEKTDHVIERKRVGDPT
jgi:hypothetical protein